MLLIFLTKSEYGIMPRTFARSTIMARASFFAASQSDCENPCFSVSRSIAKPYLRGPVGTAASGQAIPYSECGTLSPWRRCEDLVADLLLAVHGLAAHRHTVVTARIAAYAAMKLPGVHFNVVHD